MMNEAHKDINSIGASASLLTCDFESSLYHARLITRDAAQRTVFEVTFTAVKPATPIGVEMVKAALIAWTIGRFRNALAICFNFELDSRSLAFVNQLQTKVINTLTDAKGTLLFAPQLKSPLKTDITQVRNHAWIGKSGGRDSFTCADILSRTGFELYAYKISYDKSCPTANSGYATREYDVEHDTGNYETFDIPVTYLAPFWSTHDRVPEALAVGHSFDVLGFSATQRKAPYESPQAMAIHQEYLNQMLENTTRFVFPIATLSTHGVFEYIRRRFGRRVLESRVSCWNSTEIDCGYCEKCQRIKLASAALHGGGSPYLSGVPQVLGSHNMLFGNPSYDSLVRDHGLDHLAEVQLLSHDLPLDPRFAQCLYDKFSPHYQQIPSIHTVIGNTEHVSPAHVKHLVEIDYGTLPDHPITSLTQLMPYEHYFDRTHPVLSCHGSIPTYNPKTGWGTKYLGEGPRLTVPDTPIFRNFFYLNSHG